MKRKRTKQQDSNSCILDKIREHGKDWCGTLQGWESVHCFDNGVVIHGDCFLVMQQLRDSIDLVFGSPPYEDRRTYGKELEFNLEGQYWVNWMSDIVMRAVQTTAGLVGFVVGHGKQKKYRWSATPALLCADLHRRGVVLRNPKWFHRVGIPGSGGDDDLRKDVEWIVCATREAKKLPWSDNTAMGKPWKYREGGNYSNRKVDGSRDDGRRYVSGDANPGDLISCPVGGQLMGSPLSHENEAPFPESLAEFFIKTYCPPGGIVLDPFGGSGTTIAAAIKHGRKFVAIDVRRSQFDLMVRRVKQANKRLGFGVV